MPSRVFLAELELVLLTSRREGRNAARWSPAPKRVIWPLWSAGPRSKKVGVGMENPLGFPLQGSDYPADFRNHPTASNSEDSVEVSRR